MKKQMTLRNAIGLGVLGTLLILAAPTAAQSLQRIPVLVTTEAAAGGFTDPSKERSDSQKDLVKKVKI